jgi:hypothetical protein
MSSRLELDNTSVRPDHTASYPSRFLRGQKEDVIRNIIGIRNWYALIVQRLLQFLAD